MIYATMSSIQEGTCFNMGKYPNKCRPLMRGGGRQGCQSQGWQNWNPQKGLRVLVYMGWLQAWLARCLSLFLFVVFELCAMWMNIVGMWYTTTPQLSNLLSYLHLQHERLVCSSCLPTCHLTFLLLCYPFQDLLLGLGRILHLFSLQTVQE